MRTWKLILRLTIAGLGLWQLAAPTSAQTPLTTKRIASGLNNPLWVGAPVGDPRLFIAQKGGGIRVYENGVDVGLFLSISALNSNGSEQGLLGMAFDPDYANNGYFYLNYTDLAGDTVVSRWSVSDTDPNEADDASEEIIMTVSQPFTNHNAGDIAFGPDGYLYITMGDGGSSNDPGCRAQDVEELLGKILRIDVSSLPYTIPPDNPYVGVMDAEEEIWHLGLRNPWRFSFDRETGDMYIGDVGQNNREEISFAADGESNVNFGWKVLEGTRCNSSAACDASVPGCTSTEFRGPIQELTHGGFGGPLSIIGGFVYRGCAIPDLQGTYFYADYNDNLIRSVEYDPIGDTTSNFMDRTTELGPGGGLSIVSIASFGEDGFGELYIVEHRGSGNGEVYKIVPAAAATVASAVERNGGGGNDICFTAKSAPILGNVWVSEIDASNHAGASLTGMVGQDLSLSGVFIGAGEILVDIFVGNNLLYVLQASSGDIDEFSMNVPCDAAFDGFLSFTQGFIFGGTPELCNALDLTVGYY